MPDSYCIICGKKKDGIEVADDNVLATLRWIKTNVTKNARNNRLVVCKACYPEYSKMRKKYMGRRTAYVALGVLFLVLSLVISSGAWPSALLISIIIIALLYLLSLINYMPGLRIKKEVPKNKKNKA